MKPNELIILYLKKIVQEEWSVRVDCEGYSSYYDNSGQRNCKLVETYKDGLDHIPILLGLVRKEYVAFYEGTKKSSDSFVSSIKGISSFNIYLEEKQQPIYLGQIRISQEMINRGKIEIQQDYGKFVGVITFPQLIISFREL